MTDIAQVGFDYGAVPADRRNDVEAATRRLHMLERRTSEAIIEIGKELIAVKATIGHGNFLPWLKSEFGWGKSTAYRFMDVAENLGKLPNLGNIEPSALYALASPSTPDDVRDGFAELASLGNPVTHKDVQQEIARRKHVPSTPIADRQQEVIDADTGEISDYPPYEVIDRDSPDALMTPLRPAPQKTTYVECPHCQGTGRIPRH